MGGVEKHKQTTRLQKINDIKSKQITHGKQHYKRTMTLELEWENPNRSENTTMNELLHYNMLKPYNKSHFLT